MKSFEFVPVKNPDRISTYLKKERKCIALVTVFGILYNAFLFAGPVLQGKLLDTVVTTHPLSDVLKAMAYFILTICFIQVNRFYKRYYVRQFANRTSATMRMMIYNHIMHKQISEIKEENTGELLNKAISDVDASTEGIRKVMTEVFDTGILMISYLASMLVYDVKLTLGAIVFIPGAIFLAEHMKEAIVSLTKEARKQSDAVSELTYEGIDHAIFYRIFGMEHSEKDKYRKALLKYYKAQRKSEILKVCVQPLYQVIGGVGVILVIYFGGLNTIKGSWSVGDFSAYLTIYLAVTVKAGKTAKLFNSYHKAKVSWTRIKPFLKEYKEESPIIRHQETGSLIVKDLCFSYEGTENVIIKDLNFSLSAGEVLGVTGPVACGKTTLLTALLGYLPYDGQIQLNGKELREYSKAERSAQISYLSHHPELLTDTIYENITLGKAGDITKVLYTVCFDEDLKSMPDGINTVIGNNGVRLSGGQQARIALARALYHSGPLLLLDDPFSAVDKKTEQRMIQRLKEYFTDQIVIINSHRLSVFSEVSKILVLSTKAEYEIGTQKELLASSKLYRELYQLQQGGTQNEKA